MQCKCGGMIPLRTHKVETQSGAAKWLDEPAVPLPVMVSQWECGSCGRYRHEIHDADGIQRYPEIG